MPGAMEAVISQLPPSLLRNLLTGGDTFPGEFTRGGYIFLNSDKGGGVLPSK